MIQGVTIGKRILSNTIDFSLCIRNPVIRKIMNMEMAIFMENTNKYENIMSLVTFISYANAYIEKRDILNYNTRTGTYDELT